MPSIPRQLYNEWGVRCIKIVTSREISSLWRHDGGCLLMRRRGIGIGRGWMYVCVACFARTFVQEMQMVIAGWDARADLNADATEDEDQRDPWIVCAKAVLLFPPCVFGGFALKKGDSAWIGEGVVVLHSDWTEISVPHGIKQLWLIKWTSEEDVNTVGERTLGIGIDHKKMEKVWSNFYQLSMF